MCHLVQLSWQGGGESYLWSSLKHKAYYKKPTLSNNLVSFLQQAPLCGTVRGTQFWYSASKNHHKAILNKELGFSFHKWFFFLKVSKAMLFFGLNCSMSFIFNMVASCDSFIIGDGPWVNETYCVAVWPSLSYFLALKLWKGIGTGRTHARSRRTASVITKLRRTSPSSMSTDSINGRWWQLQHGQGQGNLAECAID